MYKPIQIYTHISFLIHIYIKRIYCSMNVVLPSALLRDIYTNTY